MESMDSKTPVHVEDEEDISSTTYSCSDFSSFSFTDDAYNDVDERCTVAAAILQQQQQESRKETPTVEDDAEESRCSPHLLSRSSILRSSRSDSSASVRQRSSPVSFDSVTVRRYDQTIGDNPSVSYGTPISLDWSYEEYDALDFDEYESSKPLQRRTLRGMALSHYRRKSLLMNEYGFTKDEMNRAKKEANKVKFRRGLVNHFGPSLMHVEFAVERIGREVKKSVGVR